MKISNTIEWIGKERFCRWNGVQMTRKYMRDKYGADGEIWIDKPGILWIGDTLYCSDITLFIKMIKRQLQKQSSKIYTGNLLDMIANRMTPSEKDYIESSKVLSLFSFKSILPYEEHKKLDLVNLRKFWRELTNYYSNRLKDSN